MFVSEALSEFFTQQSKINPQSADLLERLQGFGTKLEIQVNVSSEGGVPVAGKRHTYTDDSEEWYNFRIPKGAATDPNWKDYTLNWDMPAHCDAIGSTGWDWVNKQSIFVGFDFDSIIGHSTVGLLESKLHEIRSRAQEITWAEVRNSTSGNGLHFYIWLAGVSGIETHTEHAAVARAVLAKMSEECGFDFSPHVDVCGHILWCCATRATPETESFALIKEASEPFTADMLDKNWRDHIDVITRRRSRRKLTAIQDDEEEMFLDLTSAYPRDELDDTHKEIRSKLEAMDWDTYWMQDHYLLQTHTKALASLAGYKGSFVTTSSGSTSCNSFCYPGPNGSWKVFRFGQGVKEHESWTHGDWTWTWFNKAPSLEAAALSVKAAYVDESTFETQNLKDAIKVVRLITDDSTFSPVATKEMFKRSCVLKQQANGYISLVIKREREDDTPSGWNSTKRGYWTYILRFEQVEEEEVDYDDQIRCLETPEGKPAGWMVKRSRSSGWMAKSPSSVRNIFQANGLNKPESDQQMGVCEIRPWEMVQIPFTDEYPGDRKWNIDAPQLAFSPSIEPEPHIHWDLMLDHIGTSLDEHMVEYDWAASGREYIQAWIAAAIREPFEPLPYLALYGPQNSGKSILHEAIALLITSGVVKADRALTSKSDFNGELQNCVFAIVEEKDIARTPGALNKIKDVVTAVMLSIRKMRMDSYMIKNSTHWIQCCNEIGAIPVFPGDTRITMVYVGILEREIPKPKLLKHLQMEAPAFLRTIYDFKLPPYTGRLRIPVIETEDKKTAQELSRNSLETFLSEWVEPCEGQYILYKDFYNRFFAELPPGESWSRVKVSKKMPLEFKIVRRANNVAFIDNAKWREEPNRQYLSNVHWKENESQDPSV